MKFSMVQVAALALVCSVSCAPSNMRARQDSDVEKPSNSGYAVDRAPIVGDDGARDADEATKGNSKDKATGKEKAEGNPTQAPKKVNKPKDGDGDRDDDRDGDRDDGLDGDRDDDPDDDGKDDREDDGGDDGDSNDGKDGDSKDGDSKDGDSKDGNPGKAPGAPPGAVPAPYPTGVPPPATPTSGGGGGGASTVLPAAQTIAPGGSFDGGGDTFDRGVSCDGQTEGGAADAVFVVQAGGSLSNVVIGPNQIEGVHCYGGCKITNVVWTKVCEDAFTVREQAAGETTTVTGGSASGAADKIFQFNGAGTLSISNFKALGFQTAVRNCGNCAQSHERHIMIDGVTASDGTTLCGINTNFGDTCTVTNTQLSGVKNVCMKYNGVARGSEPERIGAGADGTSCIYGSDVTGADVAEAAEAA